MLKLLAAAPIIFLPPASEGWGKVMFSQVCVRSQGGGGGVPQSHVLSQVTGPRSFLGDTPVLARGVPHPWPGDSRASTCYTARGMPLAITQEDFLFLRNFKFTILSRSLALGNV